MKYFILVLSVFSTFIVVSQSNLFSLKIKINAEENKAGFYVNVFSENKGNKYESNSKGNVDVNSLEYAKEYDLVVFKKGYVSKTIKIDAKKGYYPDETVFEEVEIELKMIPKKEFVDYKVVTNKPVGKIEISEESGVLQNNISYATKRKKEIDLFLMDVDKIEKERKEQFEYLLKQVRESIDDNEVNKAISLLVKAESIVVNQKTEETREFLEIAIARIKDGENALGKILTVADTLYERKDYQKSLGYYKRVLRLAPDNLIAKSRIDEINIILVNNEKRNDVKREVKLSTEEIIANAKRMQEKRIEKFQYRDMKTSNLTSVEPDEKVNK